ncbi:hypothetical protein [Bradyrhizobium erythrophlei]|uniref:Uncharacterized protein n=1 Tax=Bradyrhizobium erythrophlei TaxID=1437360 RepID=A0A1M5RFE2_9BRAD|nr:hypothetical protein [Bradyrhizobium erythrophlei]SHH25077.1 hypothetical protein SAMN05444169_6539 [Bradyrhizobium erythrophlei]
MNFQISQALQSKLTGRSINDAPAFIGPAIKIGADTLERWKAAYRHIDEWPAALQAIDDYCAANPADNARQIARASAWLERRNFQNRNDSNEAIRLEERSF